MIPKNVPKIPNTIKTDGKIFNNSFDVDVGNIPITLLKQGFL
mgnify:CR=1 FL=1